ncbi:MAG: PadR family transcriptional regulator [Candidatus Thermoplasmatota archaeon]|jgi:DNA-binding PadR family transcriptional regulator|nr:PadR family transcriptional regulator [Candidatus Thermoplasmatota archaeon]
MRNEKRERQFKGIISLLVLKSIWSTPKHGYNLENEISERIGEKLSEGEIYSLLKHMEIRGFVKSHTKVENGRVRRYYEINPEGRKFFMKHRTPLMTVGPIMEELLDFMAKVDKDSGK